jgi:hypothetical protein
LAEQLNTPSLHTAVTGGVPLLMQLAFAGIEAAVHVGPLGPGVGVGPGVGPGPGAGVGAGDDCLCMTTSAVALPVTVTVVSPRSYPDFVARSVNRPLVGSVTQKAPTALDVVDNVVSFTATVAEDTGVLPVSSFVMPQMLNVVGGGAGGAGAVTVTCAVPVTL